MTERGAPELLASYGAEEEAWFRHPRDEHGREFDAETGCLL
jgi:hypothetical protein